MPTCCFISVMGTQIMGTINPLLSLLADGFIISRVHLLVSDDVLEVGTHFEEFCTSLGLETEIELVAMPPYPDEMAPLARDAALIAAQAAQQRGERCIFNLNGSTNQMIAQCALSLAPMKPLWMQATHNRFLLDDGGKLRQCRAADVLKVGDIFQLQGAEVESVTPQADAFSVIAFCQKERIALPRHALLHQQVGTIPFEAIWTESNNRLAFLVSHLQTSNSEDRNLRLARERAIARWAASRDGSWHLFDRAVYALVDSDTTAEHVYNESNGKIRIIHCRGYERDKRILVTALKEVFQPQALYPAQAIKAKNRKALEFAPQTLIVAMGDKPSATLLTIASHKPRHVALCYTESVLAQATCLRELCYQMGVESVRLIPCEFEGYDLPACFAVPQNPEHVFVNVTPGTKGQGAYLALWAQQVGCAVWAIQPQTQTLERLDAQTSPIALRAPDPLLLLEVRGERPVCDVEEQKQYSARNTALLAFLRSALGHDREKVIFKEAVNIEGNSLHRPAKKDWELRLQTGAIYPFSLEGGEWLELLAAEAFSQAGAHFAHARVRLLWSEGQEKRLFERIPLDKRPFRMDIDVLGSYGGGHFLVSCKSNPQSLMEETIQEAHNMAKAIDRFTVALVCHLGCQKAYFDEKYKVMVLGWRELCQPEILQDYLQRLRAKFDTYQAKS